MKQSVSSRGRGGPASTHAHRRKRSPTTPISSPSNPARRGAPSCRANVAPDVSLWPETAVPKATGARLLSGYKPTYALMLFGNSSTFYRRDWRQVVINPNTITTAKANDMTVHTISASPSTRPVMAMKGGLSATTTSKRIRLKSDYAGAFRGSAIETTSALVATPSALAIGATTRSAARRAGSCCIWA